MTCPKCNFEQPDQNLECMRCGIIFEKFRSGRQIPPQPSPIPFEPEADDEGSPGLTKDLLFYVNPQINPLIFWGRVLFFLVILIWGLKFIFTPMQSHYVFKSFWHLVDLPFHEFGHIIFRPFGRFMTSLGGSLAQVLMPLICLAVFLIKYRNTFAASFCLWWVGENFMDLAPYIDDARRLTLPLVGGNTGRTSPYGFHDWEFILKESGLIRYDHTLAKFSFAIGCILMLCAFIWGGYILLKQYRLMNNKDGKSPSPTSPKAS
jgi:hypothetical protein